MEWIPWVLVAVLVVISLVLATRRGKTGDRDALVRLAREAEGPGIALTPHADDPPEAARVRTAVATPRPSAVGGEGDGEAALRGLFRYLENAVLASLKASVRGKSGSPELQDAVNALEDLGFYARERRAESVGTANLGTIVQAVTREYALDTGTPVRFQAPPDLLAVQVAPEAFKDALYLLLANAGHFGKGEPIEVMAEPAGEGVRLTIRDRGPGFTLEALDRAFEPFWTSEDDALGLGLTHARKALDSHGATLSIRNREGGGAEVEILLLRGR